MERITSPWDTLGRNGRGCRRSRGETHHLSGTMKSTEIKRQRGQSDEQQQRQASRQAACSLQFCRARSPVGTLNSLPKPPRAVSKDPLSSPKSGRLYVS